tara:strand:- start:252 stop:380 length:129 start_codon:yes stop_codon:yes gene_type:complete
MMDEDSIAFSNKKIKNTNADLTIENNGFSTPSMSLSTKLIEK